MHWTKSDALLMWLAMDHSRISEAWGDPLRMHPITMVILDKFRGSLPHGCWVKVHCGYKAGRHIKNSFHHRARAVDFHVVGCSFIEAEQHLMRFLNGSTLTICETTYNLIDFVGIGIYPEWADPGFHLDTRGKRNSWAKVGGVHVSYEAGLLEAKNREL